MKTRLKLLGRFGEYLIWESVAPLPGDSRHVQYSCRADWFYGTMR